MHKACLWAKTSDLLMDNKPDDEYSDVIHNPDSAVSLFDNDSKD